jgi:hypothetical protein
MIPGLPLPRIMMENNNHHHEDRLPLPHSVGFIGAGKMATAMASGFITSGTFISRL